MDNIHFKFLHKFILDLHDFFLQHIWCLTQIDPANNMENNNTQSSHFWPGKLTHAHSWVYWHDAYVHVHTHTHACAHTHACTHTHACAHRCIADFFLFSVLHLCQDICLLLEILFCLTKTDQYYWLKDKIIPQCVGFESLKKVKKKKLFLLCIYIYMS